MHFDRSPYPGRFSRICSAALKILTVAVFAMAFYLIATSLATAIDMKNKGETTWQNNGSTRR